MIGAQLPLAVQLRESASFQSYHAGPNADALAALRELAQPILVYGPAGSGRSHLLQAVARARGAPCLSLPELRGHGPEVLEGFATVPVLCLDDLEAVTDDRRWCVALTRLLDGLRVRGARFVVASVAPPERLAIALPDLRTRLAACACYGLKPLTDDDRRTLLQERARARGLELADDVVRWLLNTQARDPATLVEALERLDRASLSAKRRLTLPFVQSILGAGAPPP